MSEERVCSQGTPGCFCDATNVTAWVCAWCGKHHWLEPGQIAAMTAWCAGCQEKHRAANPDAEHFKGWLPIEDTLPGGPLDGVWENSGLTLEEKP